MIAKDETVKKSRDTDRMTPKRKNTTKKRRFLSNSRSKSLIKLFVRILMVLVVLGCCYYALFLTTSENANEPKSLLRRWSSVPDEEEEEKKLLRIEHDLNVKLEERIQDIRNEQEQWRDQVEGKMMKNVANEDFLSRVSTLVESLSTKEKNLGLMDRLEEDLQYQINDLSDAMEDVMKLVYSVSSAGDKEGKDIVRMREEILPMKDCTTDLHPEAIGARDKLLVFGLGTGRSGTRGLAKLLDRQRLATVTHEYKLGTKKSYLHVRRVNHSLENHFSNIITRTPTDTTLESSQGCESLLRRTTTYQ